MQNAQRIESCRKKAEDALGRLIEREKVYSRVSGATFGFIRYKRAMKELLQYEGELDSVSDLLKVKHIGRSIAEEILKEVERAPPGKNAGGQEDFAEGGSGSQPPSKAASACSEELVYVLDSSDSAREACAAPMEPARQLVAEQTEDARKALPKSKDAFSLAYTQCAVKIKTKEPEKEKKVGYVFSVRINGHQVKVPVPFTVAHLVIDTLAYDVLDGQLVDTSSLRYFCLERAQKQLHVYGGRLVFSSVEKRVKHTSKILMRHGLIEDTGAGLLITEAGRESARTLSYINDYMHRARGRPHFFPRGVGTSGLSEKTGCLARGEDAKEQCVLLIDMREKRTRENPYFFQTSLSHAGVQAETRVLSVGDFLWALVRDKQQYYCNLLIERKTIRDLMQSVRDGRYAEQKERLKSLQGVKVYCIEGALPAEPSVLKTLYTSSYKLAASNFVVINPWRVEETLASIESMHRHVCKGPQEKNILLSDLLVRSHKRKLTSYARTDRSLIVLQAIKGVSYQVASSIVGALGDLFALLARGSTPSSLLDQLEHTVVHASGTKRVIGRKKALSILHALGLRLH
ncbi:uncharacterized protein NEMAJ01_0327 [Nematocida major]|uniref:uncharacterized protein n=1 Tax=Nematocida major TaxID=1912982 RepID=UPI00200775EB|nr:uncharacterized protein NEMAJ01_0327 [Nematocida major]KAH9385431.1 hypothetical protein NEMAJ01_0327 [Nematocida major]